MDGWTVLQLFVDRYETNPKIGASFTKFLTVAREIRGSAIVRIDRETELEDRSGLVVCPARVVSRPDDPRAWFAVQTRYVDAIEQHGRPDRWAVIRRSEPTAHGAPPILIVALRGDRGVGLVMPTTCEGSGLVAAPLDGDEVPA